MAVAHGPAHRRGDGPASRPSVVFVSYCRDHEKWLRRLRNRGIRSADETDRALGPSTKLMSAHTLAPLTTAASAVATRARAPKFGAPRARLSSCPELPLDRAPTTPILTTDAIAETANRWTSTSGLATADNEVPQAKGALMAGSDYANLFIDAGISGREDQDKYGRRLDAVLANEGITVGDILGVGEQGTGSNLDLYVVHRQAITSVSERGVFNKRIEQRRVGTIASIARLRGTQEGFKGRDVTITANDKDGGEIFKIVWGLGGPDWVEPLIERQRAHLFKVISEAMDKIDDAPARPSIASAASKAGALMDWAADVVKAADADVTPERIEEHANMIAGGIGFMVFLRLGASYGIDDLNMFYPSGKMPPGSPIATFDELYEYVVARVGSAGTVDRAIDEQLAGAWSEFVNGCRQQHA
jgi:hypothetical protein